MKSRLIVGSDDLADIVVKNPAVSRRHCELLWAEGAWLITDLDSTNGTLVNDKRITAPKVLKDTDRVTLGRSYTLSLPDAPKALEPSVDPIPRSPLNSSSKPSAEKRIRLNLWWNVALLLAGGFIFVGLLSVVTNRTSTSEKSIVTTELGTVQGNGQGKSTAVTESKIQGAASAQSALASPSRTIDSPYWAVMICNADGTESRLIGTAIAVSENRLLTLGSIVDAADAVKSDFPKLSLHHISAASNRLSPSRTVIHPKYLKAKEELTRFEKELDSRIERMESDKEPPLDESLNWSAKLEAVLMNIALHDFACIDVEEQLPFFVAMSDSAVETNSSSRRLLGFPIATPSPRIQNNLPAFFVEQKGKSRFDTINQTPVHFFDTVSAMAGLQLVSMACVDADSNLVGVCVRQAPDEGNSNVQHCQIVKPEVFWE